MFYTDGSKNPNSLASHLERVQAGLNQALYGQKPTKTKKTKKSKNK